MCHIIKLNKKTNKFEKSIINLVDNGTWALWTGMSDKDSEIKYALNTGSEYYFLDEDGKIISVNKSLDNFKRKDIARFAEMKICQVCK